jgi:hypothetical protein
MLDVHPPHAPTHTWRDFFIHIATICLGLLIAIALEQAVEHLHQAHERRALIEEMHGEAERNIGLLQEDIHRDLEQASWHLAIMNALQTEPTRSSIVTAVLPPHAEFLPQIYPSRAVWATAKTNGKVALLSESQAEVYDRLDSEADNEVAAEQRTDIALTKLQSDQIRLGIHIHPGATIHLPSSEIPTLTHDISDVVAAIHEDALRCAFWSGAARAVAARVHDREDFVPYFRQERLALEDRLSRQ